MKIMKTETEFNLYFVSKPDETIKDLLKEKNISIE